MKILGLVVGYLTLSGVMSFAIVDLYRGQTMVEDIGSAWMFYFWIANFMYLPSLLIFFGMVIQNRIFNHRSMAIALAALLIFHITIYAFDISLKFVVVTQVIILLGSLLYLKIQSGKSFKKLLGLNE